MASIRTARILAAAAALPLAAALFAGVAQADNGGFADDGSNTSVATIIGSGVGGDNFGLHHDAAGGDRFRRLQPEQHGERERLGLHRHRPDRQRGELPPVVVTGSTGTGPTGAGSWCERRPARRYFGTGVRAVAFRAA
ncbi:hypothetical protein STANM309S_04383 [Streptomyces tanashiensis]